MAFARVDLDTHKNARLEGQEAAAAGRATTTRRLGSQGLRNAGTINAKSAGLTRQSAGPAPATRTITPPPPPVAGPDRSLEGTPPPKPEVVGGKKAGVEVKPKVEARPKDAVGTEQRTSGPGATTTFTGTRPVDIRERTKRIAGGMVGAAGLLGKGGIYFGDEAKLSPLQRQQRDEAVAWYQSSAARTYFQQNPSHLGVAEGGGLRFYTDHIIAGKPVAATGITPHSGTPTLTSAPAAPTPTSVTQQSQASDLFNAVIQVESRGRPGLTSSKGAEGIAQVMPVTAGNPGFGVRKAADDSPEEKVRVGRELLAAWTERWGEEGALIAYNFSWMAAAKYDGNDISDYTAYKNLKDGPKKRAIDAVRAGDPTSLPKETSNYIQSVGRELGLQSAASTPLPEETVGPRPQAVPLKEVATAGVNTPPAPNNLEDGPNENKNAIPAAKNVPARLMSLPKTASSFTREVASGKIASAKKAWRIPSHLVDIEITAAQRRFDGFSSIYNALVQGGSGDLDALMKYREPAIANAAALGVLTAHKAATALERGDGQLAAAVISRYSGVDTQFRPRSDGRFDIFENGQMVAEGQRRATIADDMRGMVSETYHRGQLEAARAARSAKLKATTELYSKLSVERLKGLNAQKEAIIEKSIWTQELEGGVVLSAEVDGMWVYTPVIRKVGEDGVARDYYNRAPVQGGGAASSSNPFASFKGG